MVEEVQGIGLRRKSENLESLNVLDEGKKERGGGGGRRARPRGSLDPKDTKKRSVYALSFRFGGKYIETGTHESIEERNHVLRSGENDGLVKERTSEGEEGSRDEAPVCERQDVRVSDDFVNDFDGEVGGEGRVQHECCLDRRKKGRKRLCGSRKRTLRFRFLPSFFQLVTATSPLSSPTLPPSLFSYPFRLWTQGDGGRVQG